MLWNLGSGPEVSHLPGIPEQLHSRTVWVQILHSEKCCIFSFAVSWKMQVMRVFPDPFAIECFPLHFYSCKSPAYAILSNTLRFNNWDSDSTIIFRDPLICQGLWYELHKKSQSDPELETFCTQLSELKASPIFSLKTLKVKGLLSFLLSTCPHHHPPHPQPRDTSRQFFTFLCVLCLMEVNKLFFHKPSCRVLGVGSLGSDSILKVVTSTELFQKMQGSFERAWAALPLLGWQAGMIILWCTYGHEMCVMFVHFSNDSGDVLWFSHLALKLAFCSTDNISPACDAKLNAQHFIQAHKTVLFL